MAIMWRCPGRAGAAVGRGSPLVCCRALIPSLPGASVTAPSVHLWLSCVTVQLAPLVSFILFLQRRLLAYVHMCQCIRFTVLSAYVCWWVYYCASSVVVVVIIQDQTLWIQWVQWVFPSACVSLNLPVTPVKLFSKHLAALQWPVTISLLVVIA